MSMSEKKKKRNIGKDFADGYKAQYGPKKRKPGGGRKPGEPTKVIRVPVSKLEAVKELIKKKHCPRCLSEDVIMFTSDLDLCRGCGHTFL